MEETGPRPAPAGRGPQSQGGARPPADWVSLLADEIGPRRPTGPAERIAAERTRDALSAAGLPARLEPFRGYSTFAAPYGAATALALAAGLVGRRRPLLRHGLALSAATALLAEGGLVRTPLSDLFSRRHSQNLVAEVEPTGGVRRTLCLMCHLDTSRSGLMFDPRLVGRLNQWLALQSVACMVQAADPVAGRTRAGRILVAAARGVLAAGAAALAERELRGEDVPGANDNASGVAVVASLGLALAARPPDSTRVVILMSGCEEAGMLGAQAFLRSRDTREWLFLNFDNVGAGTLHFLEREGLIRKWQADPGLLSVARRLARERPELALSAAPGPIGLTYDATPVLARGGRALTLVAAVDGTIPNYHWPSDTAANVEADALERALATGRELVAAVDRGEADDGRA